MSESEIAWNFFLKNGTHVILFPLHVSQIGGGGGGGGAGCLKTGALVILQHQIYLCVMARSHCTGLGTMGYYIICRTVHTAPEQGHRQGPENLSKGFQPNFLDLKYFPVYFVMDFSYINNISRSHFQSQSLCNVNITPRSLSLSRAVWKRHYFCEKINWIPLTFLWQMTICSKAVQTVLHSLSFF